MKLGWQDGPNQRGTLTILWSCLSTVVACTWTILHLNVPGTCDKAGRKILRKAKWMLVTVLFPEFLFSKAVCELQMAVDDLYAMKQKKKLLGRKFQWEVEEFGWGLQFLHGLFHLFSKPLETESSDEEEKSAGAMGVDDVPTGDGHALAKQAAIYPSTNSYDPQVWPHERVWTLTHSYFANMGGFERHHPPEMGNPCQGNSCEEQKSNPITAYALVNCCVGKEHDPLPDLYLERDDIEDKAKLTGS
jgi:hypothetical protein